MYTRHVVLTCLIFAAACGVSVAELSEGLVAHYSFSGNANEVTGRGNDGVVYGADLTFDRCGVASGAYSFDGIDNYIEVNHSENLNIANASTWTVAFWFRSTKSSDYQQLVDKYNSANSDGWGVDLDEMGRIVGRLNNGSSGCSGCTSSFNLRAGGGFNDGSWHHVAVVFDATSATRVDSIRFWVDGTFHPSEDFLPYNPYAQFQNYNHTEPLEIGRTYYNYPYWFEGAIDEIRIYSRALTAGEIQSFAYELCDLDGDGFPPPADCNDADPAINPDGIELPGNLVDENCDGDLGSCSPCAAWRNHGDYVRCVAQSVNELVSAGDLTEEEGDTLVSSAAQTDIGKKGHVEPGCTR